MSNAEEDVPKRYALRLTPRSERDISEAINHFIDIAGSDIAQLWRSRLFEEIARLATNPTRFPIVTEMQYLKGFRHEFRHLVWRRTATSVAYRIIFWIEEDSDDAPTVSIGYIRHASAKPITRKEATGMQDRGDDNS